MRCPHCRSKRIENNRCQICGGDVLAPASVVVSLEVERCDEQRLPSDVPTAGHLQCPRCGRDADGADFCSHCGAVLKRISRIRAEFSEIPLRCLRCGFENDRRRDLCVNCGERL